MFSASCSSLVLHRGADLNEIIVCMNAYELGLEPNHYFSCFILILNHGKLYFKQSTYKHSFKAEQSLIWGQCLSLKIDIYWFHYHTG